MTYYIDEFVNFTAPEQGRYVDMSADVNTNSSDVLYDEIPRKFSNWFEWDNCIHQAGPIIIWENNDMPVAYRDCEYCTGHFLVVSEPEYD